MPRTIASCRRANASLSLAIVAAVGAPALGFVEPFVFGGLVTPATDLPESVSSQDLNDDGHLDLVVVGAEEVLVFFGDGCGAFMEAQRLAGGNAGLVVADVTGDGVADLVVGSTSACEILLFVGQDGGTFTEGLGIPTSCGPATVVVADFNNDEINDIATANVQSQNLSVLIGLGGGAFDTPLTIATPVSSGVGSLAAFDIENDGDVDLISAGSNGVTIHRNARGAFPTRTVLSAGLSPRSVQVGDVNNDGRPDIAVANSATNRVSILRQFAPGQFLPPQTVSVGASPERILLAHLDDDGSLDMAVSHPSTIIEISDPNEDAPEGSVGLFGGEVRTYRNNGSGSFLEADRIFAGAWPRAFAAGDFNSDGLTDLASVSRVLPSATAPFIMSGEVTEGAGDNAVGLVSLALGTGDVKFASGKRVLSAGASQVKLADLDNDGDLDLFEGRSFGILLRRNTGDGLFKVLVGGVNTTGLPQMDPSFDLGNIDDDSRLDIVIATFEGIKTAFGNGSGAFSPFVTVDTAPFRSIALADINGDHVLDIIGGAVREQTTDRAVVLIGNGFGGFDRVAEAMIPSDPFMVIAEDFNGDSIPDAAFACRDSMQVAVVILAADGGVTSVQPVNVFGTARGLRAVDFDRDGDQDLVAASFSLNGGAAILINDGNGHFTYQQQVGSFTDVPDVDEYDFDFDGWPDVLIPDAERDVVQLFRNDQLGGFVHIGAMATGDYPRSIAVGDVNGDDRPDVVVAAQQTETSTPGLLTFSAVMSHFNERIGPSIIGDITGEGVVGAADLAALLAQWGPCPGGGACSADLNQDGVVNGDDLATVLANWS